MTTYELETGTIGFLEQIKQEYAENCGSSNWEELKYMSSEPEEKLIQYAIKFNKENN